MRIGYLFMKKSAYLSSIALLAMVSINADALTSECPYIAASDKSVVSSPSIVGLAKDKNDNTMLYCEYHYSINNSPKLNNSNNSPKLNNSDNSPKLNNSNNSPKLNSSHNNLIANNPSSNVDAREKQFLVEYRDTNQSLIAYKKLSYQGSLLQPEVMQEDLRHGERREVLFSNTNELSSLRVQYQKPNGGDLKQKNFPLSDSLVIDAGFDEAVRQNWTRLLDGEIVKMDFLSPVHLQKFNLSIKITADERFVIGEGGDNQKISFLIRPSNSFINLFAKPLLLKYDKKSQRLLDYSGNVNITSKDGDTIEATIQYYYRDEVVQKSL